MKAPRYNSLLSHFLVFLYCLAGCALPSDSGFGGANAATYFEVVNCLGRKDALNDGIWVCNVFLRQRVQRLRLRRPGVAIEDSYKDKCYGQRIFWGNVAMVNISRMMTIIYMDALMMRRRADVLA